jgi:hypothetical protein
MPYKNKNDKLEAQKRYLTRKKESIDKMEQNFKLFSSVVKAHFLSGAEPSDVALEVFDDHSHLLADGFLDDKMKNTKMTPRDIAPRDEDEEKYLTMTRPQRQEELKNLKKKMEILENIEFNYAVVDVHNFTDDVISEMKIIESKRELEVLEARQPKRQRSRDNTPSGTPAPAPARSPFSFFGAK